MQTLIFTVQVDDQLAEEIRATGQETFDLNTVWRRDETIIVDYLPLTLQDEGALIEDEAASQEDDTLADALADEPA